jgi:GTPase SAR1 family protein
MEENILIPEPEVEKKYLRIMIVGDPKTGKTSFLQQNSHPQNIYFFKINTVDKILQDEIHGVMVFMDVSDPTGLVKALKWIEQVNERVPYKLPILLVVNKIDLVNHVSVKAIERTVTKWICCSCKSGLNVKQVTMTMQDMIMAKIKAELFNALLPTKEPDLSLLEELMECLI